MEEDAESPGSGSSGSSTGKTPPPVYSLQALWDGNLTLKEFEVTGLERPTVPHNVFEHEEILPVIDASTLLLPESHADRQASLLAMLEAAKTWGFFKIRNHGVPLQVVTVSCGATRLLGS